MFFVRKKYCSNLVRDYAPGRQVIDERGSCKATPSPGIEPGSPKDRDFESRAVPLCHEGFENTSLGLFLTLITKKLLRRVPSLQKIYKAFYTLLINDKY